MDWQSMDTAPRDGTMLLLYLVNPLGYPDRQCVAAWQRYTFQTDAEACWHDSGGVMSIPPSHAVRWMPLPIPPEDLGASDANAQKVVEVTKVTDFSVNVI